MMGFIPFSTPRLVRQEAKFVRGRTGAAGGLWDNRIPGEPSGVSPGILRTAALIGNLCEESQPLRVWARLRPWARLGDALRSGFGVYLTLGAVERASLPILISCRAEAKKTAWSW